MTFNLKTFATICAILMLGLGSTLSAQQKIQLIMFTPADRSVPAHARKKLTQVADSTEKFYFTWMNHWGYPPGTTNLFKRKEDGLVELLEIKGDEPATSAKYNKFPHDKWAAEIKEAAGKQYNIPSPSVCWVFVYLGDRPTRLEAFEGAGNSIGGGWALVNYDSLPGDYVSGDSLVKGYNGDAFLKGMIHELGHGLGLPHMGPEVDLGLGNSLMGPTTKLYENRKLPKPDEVYLSEASAAMLWKHPIFAGTNMGNYQRANVKLLDYKVEYSSTNDCITLSGKLESDQHVHSVVVIDKPVKMKDEHWQPCHSARIASDGTFQMTIKHPMHCDGQWRIFFCFDNGMVSGDGRRVWFGNRGEIKKAYHFQDGNFHLTE